MPSVCRRIAVLVAVACLGVALPAQLALAQSGAGDSQYSDPFGKSKTSTSSTKSAATTPSLSSAPQPTSTPTTPAPTATTPTHTVTVSPSTGAVSGGGQLPNTGLDARVLVLLGAVLLLGGLGLRLRSAPERF